jgi:hypothetical protein
MAPLVAVGGWRAAYVVPAAALVASVLALAAWLERAGRSPRFALLVLGYPPALVLGRVGMSDVPAMAITALALVLLLRAVGADGAKEGPPSRAWLLHLVAGLLIGASSVVRDVAPLVLLPLVAGSLLRRDRGAWALVVGGLLGGGLRLLGQWIAFGDALQVRGSYYGFSAVGLSRNAGLVLLSTLVLVPGGLVALAGYRGPRRLELVSGVAGILGLMLFYEYGALESGALKRIVLGGRYALPVLPLLVVLAADTFPRLWAAALARRPGLERAGRAVVWAWTAGVVLACFGVHAALGPWARAQGRIASAVEEATTDGAVVITSWDAASKHLNELHGVRVPVDRRSVVDARGAIDDAVVRRALERGRGAVFVAFIERDDSARWRENAAENAAFVLALGARWRLELVTDERPTATDRVRVWRLRGPA